MPWYLGRGYKDGELEVARDCGGWRPHANSLLLPVKLITSFLISYPLAGVLKRVPDAKPAYKNLFIIGYV